MGLILEFHCNALGPSNWYNDFLVSNYLLKMVNQRYSLVEWVKLIYESLSFHSIDVRCHTFSTF